jgi:hypothetical protein
MNNMPEKQVIVHGEDVDVVISALECASRKDTLDLKVVRLLDLFPHTESATRSLVDGVSDQSLNPYAVVWDANPHDAYDMFEELARVGYSGKRILLHAELGDTQRLGSSADYTFDLLGDGYVGKISQWLED